jgi:hypothetical protein
MASQQDDLAISFTCEEVATKMIALAHSRSVAELRRSYRLCTTSQWNYSEARQFVRAGKWQSHIGHVSYRPFDHRWSVLHRHILTILRKNVMSQLGRSPRHIGLIASRAVNDLEFAHCFVAKCPVDKIFISSKTSTNAYIFPLYVEVSDLGTKRQGHNFSRPFIEQLAPCLRTGGIDRHTGLPHGIDAEDIFHYMYAILHSPTYRSRYSEFLKIDFARLPLPATRSLFDSLASLGEELARLHLMTSPLLANLITTYTGPKHPEVGRVGWSADTVWLDAGPTKKGETATPGTTGFRGVPEAVWKFHIGGYQVCEKWLKDRKGRTLSDDDILHYQKIVVALAETIRLMREVDEIIGQRGGWPGGFVLLGRSSIAEARGQPEPAIAE